MEFFADTPILVDAYRHVLQLLQSVKHYPYHNIGHTLDVFRRARYLSRAENISTEDTVDVLLAALFHDTGFIESYTKNEVIGARLARDYLTRAGHPEKRIQKIETFILATIPFTPTHHILEQILQDADLDNLGRDDCFSKMQKVEEELRSMQNLSTEVIYDIFSGLHQKYRFQTRTAQMERQEKKLANAEKFRDILKKVSILSV